MEVEIDRDTPAFTALQRAVNDETVTKVSLATGRRGVSLKRNEEGWSHPLNATITRCEHGFSIHSRCPLED